MTTKSSLITDRIWKRWTLLQQNVHYKEMKSHLGKPYTLEPVFTFLGNIPRNVLFSGMF
jgi:hypothetical protein